MKKIAVLRCLRVSASCAGSGCLRAMYEKTGAYAKYAGEDVQMAAFWTCNGCGENTLPNQEGVHKKIERMKKIPVEAVHISNCAMPKNAEGQRVMCPVIAEIAKELEAAGIEIVEGTH